MLRGAKYTQKRYLIAKKGNYEKAEYVTRLAPWQRLGWTAFGSKPGGGTAFTFVTLR